MTHVRRGRTAKRIRQDAARARLERSQAFMTESNRLLAEAGIEGWNRSSSSYDLVTALVDIAEARTK
jgi:hypothetical protein